MSMDEASVRAQLERHWEYAGTDQDIAHEIYHDDAVLEFPQSGERFEGVENFREWRRQYPAVLEFQDPTHPRCRGSVGGRELDQLRRWAVAVHREHPRVPRRQGGARVDLHHPGLGTSRMAGTVEERTGVGGRRPGSNVGGLTGATGSDLSRGRRARGSRRRSRRRAGAPRSRRPPAHRRPCGPRRCGRGHP